ncbi:pentapeptide repeat-containing protein [Ktedonobacter robiniae]|nr:pentapeptide repeat-containing protein [Ktedonobacter robiniae]
MDGDDAGDGLPDLLPHAATDNPEISQIAQQRLGQVLKTLNGDQQVSMVEFFNHNGLPATFLGDGLQGSKALVGADLQKIVLPQINLAQMDLRRVNFREANLQGSDLSGANLTETTLTEANIEGANLTEANLSKATLIGANLRQADLSGARLTLAIFEMADLREAKVTDEQLGTIGSGEALKREP